MSDAKDWLILSLKWSAGSDWLVWYRPNSNGYTTNLNDAGHYTQEEACKFDDDVTLGVPIEAANRLAKVRVLVEAGVVNVDTLREAAAQKRAEQS